MHVHVSVIIILILCARMCLPKQAASLKLMSTVKRCSVPYGPERKPWRETLSKMAVTMSGDLLVSPPSTDPLQLISYPEVAGITCAFYQLPSCGLPPGLRQRALRETSAKAREVTSCMIGFQANEKFDCSIMSQLNGVHLDNEGDPFMQCKVSTVGNTKWLERNVLDYYASLWHAKWPHNPSDPDSYWGYIAGLGSTEGNIFAVQSARDYLSGMFLVSSVKGDEDPRPVQSFVQGTCKGCNSNALKPVGFFSAESHYGIAKSFQVSDTPTFHDIGIQFYPNENPLGGKWPRDVPCEEGDAGPGCIDLDVLATLVDFFTGKGHPIIVVFNYGSTFKGAFDDIQRAEEVILPILKKNDMYERRIYNPANPGAYVIRKGFWFHVDGALSCSYMPFVEMGHNQGIVQEAPGPLFDFRLECVSSIVTSTGKWIGAPWPGGIYLTKTGLQVSLSAKSTLNHCNLSKLTFSCSRNAHIPVYLWSSISATSFDDEVEKIQNVLQLANYAEAQLRRLEKELQQDLWVSRTRLSLAIYFKKPNKEIVHKYSLSGKFLYFYGELREYSHIYIMGHIQREHIDSFIQDLQQPGAFPFQKC